jgi:hypothetical protein
MVKRVKKRVRMDVIVMGVNVGEGRRSLLCIQRRGAKKGHRIKKMRHNEFLVVANCILNG